MTEGYLDGKRVFHSQNLRGLIDYGRKHGIANVELGECITHAGLYLATFGNGATCKGEFADPRIMLGFFLGQISVDVIECERTVFNKGTAMGRYRISFLLPLPRDEVWTLGPWLVKPYRDGAGTPMVNFTRQ